MSALKNSRQERFAQELAKGSTADAAYGAAGYKPDRDAASRLSAKLNVQARVAELQERAAKKVLVTLETIAEQLDADRQLAHREGQAGPAVAATMGKAKLFGLIVDKAKLEASGPGGGPIELLAVRERIAQLPAEIRAEMRSLLLKAKP